MNYTLTTAERVALACIAEMIAEIPKLQNDNPMVSGMAKTKIDILNTGVKMALELDESALLFQGLR